MPNAIIQHWEESEAGWGCRPDGISLHKTEADAIAYNKSYWARQPAGPAPHEYSRPCGKARLIEIPRSLAAKIKGHGHRMEQWELRDYEITKFSIKKKLVSKRKAAKK